MNSFLRGFGNSPERSYHIPQAPKQQAPNILMQAFGAALRGESPQEFMQNLAQTHPELKQYDFSNLSAAAQQVCQENGVDMQSAIDQMDSITNTLMSSSR